MSARRAPYSPRSTRIDCCRCSWGEETPDRPAAGAGPFDAETRRRGESAEKKAEKKNEGTLGRHFRHLRPLKIKDFPEVSGETRRARRKRGENQREKQREKRREERRGTREVRQIEAHLERKLVTARLLEESES